MDKVVEEIVKSLCVITVLPSPPHNCEERFSYHLSQVRRARKELSEDAILQKWSLRLPLRFLMAGVVSFCQQREIRALGTSYTFKEQGKHAWQKSSSCLGGSILGSLKRPPLKRTAWRCKGNPTERLLRWTAPPCPAHNSQAGEREKALP